jgi:hypothetical protein
MGWIAFIDESGDHGLAKIDPGSPMFTLTAAIYREDVYLNRELPAIAALKHRFWHHEGVIFRSYDINKRQGAFSICQHAERRQELWNAIAEHFRASPVKLIAAVIDKERHAAQYVDPADAYFLAVQFVLERIHMMAGTGVKLVIESRGKKEDQILAEWCERISGGENFRAHDFGCTAHFAKKHSNVAGLQIADLACQPITHYVRNPDTQRADWLAVKSRVRSDWRGRIEGRGLKVFPA